MAGLLRVITRLAAALIGLALLALALFVLALSEAPGFFIYHTSDGRLSIWSDEPDQRKTAGFFSLPARFVPLEE